MKYVFLALLAIAATTANNAYGHGFRITTNAGKLVLFSDDPTAAGLSIYKVQSLLGPATFRSESHPGFDVQSGISTGSIVRFDVLGPLWYSTGSGAPVASPVDLEITAQDISIPGSVTVTGVSGFQSGFIIGEYDGSSLGAIEHQLFYAFDVPSGVPTGAFAVTMHLTGTDGSGQPFVASDPFVAVFNNGLAQEFPTVASQLYAAAILVPEPSSAVLLGLAGLGLPFLVRRARRSRKS